MENLEQLKAVVAHSLEAKGVLPRIRAELRKQVYLAIEEQDSERSFVSSAKATAWSESPAGRSCMALVREFLEFYDLDCTLSVLQAEANLHALDHPDTLDGLYAEYHGKMADNHARPLLMMVLETASAQPNGSPTGAYGSRSEEKASAFSSSATAASQSSQFDDRAVGSVRVSLPQVFNAPLGLSSNTAALTSSPSRDSVLSAPKSSSDAVAPASTTPKRSSTLSISIPQASSSTSSVIAPPQRVPSHDDVIEDNGQVRQKAKPDLQSTTAAGATLNNADELKLSTKTGASAAFGSMAHASGVPSSVVNRFPPQPSSYHDAEYDVNVADDDDGVDEEEEVIGDDDALLDDSEADHSQSGTTPKAAVIKSSVGSTSTPTQPHQHLTVMSGDKGGAISVSPATSVQSQAFSSPQTGSVSSAPNNAGTVPSSAVTAVKGSSSPSPSALTVAAASPATAPATLVGSSPVGSGGAAQLSPPKTGLQGKVQFTASPLSVSSATSLPSEAGARAGGASVSAATVIANGAPSPQAGARGSLHLPGMDSDDQREDSAAANDIIDEDDQYSSAFPTPVAASTPKVEAPSSTAGKPSANARAPSASDEGPIAFPNAPASTLVSSSSGTLASGTFTASVPYRMGGGAPASSATTDGSIVSQISTVSSLASSSTATPPVSTAATLSAPAGQSALGGLPPLRGVSKLPPLGGAKLPPVLASVMPIVSATPAITLSSVPPAAVPASSSSSSAAAAAAAGDALKPSRSKESLNRPQELPADFRPSGSDSKNESMRSSLGFGEADQDYADDLESVVDEDIQVDDDDADDALNSLYKPATVITPAVRPASGSTGPVTASTSGSASTMTGPSSTATKASTVIGAAAVADRPLNSGSQTSGSLSSTASNSTSSGSMVSTTNANTGASTTAASVSSTAAAALSPVATTAAARSAGSPYAARNLFGTKPSEAKTAGGSAVDDPYSDDASVSDGFDDDFDYTENIRPA